MAALELKTGGKTKVDSKEEINNINTAYDQLIQEINKLLKIDEPPE